eukprot:COSAG01_NODE_6960_length_3415_cov_698.105247_4_plen_161_part_00
MGDTGAPPLRGADIVWSWKGGGKWRKFSATEDTKIEAAFRAFEINPLPPYDEVSIGGGRLVNFQTMRQVRADDRTRTRPVKRAATGDDAHKKRAHGAGAADTTRPPRVSSTPTAVTIATTQQPVPAAVWLWADSAADGTMVWKEYAAAISSRLETAHNQV